MRIGFLECEYFSGAGTADPGPGDYTDLFRDFLTPTSGSLEIALIPVDVHGGALPQSVHDFDGYIVSGSYAGVHDDLPWMEELVLFLREAHRRHLPLVGICFGHQVLAHALGGSVARAPLGWNLGVHETILHHRYPWMDSGLRTDSLHLVYVHQDQVLEAPPEAFTFARTEHCPCAGFILGDTVLTIQGHPEYTADRTRTLIETTAGRFSDQTIAKALSSISAEETAIESNRTRVARWITRFLLDARGPEVERLSQAIQLRTVAGDTAPFSRFESFLEGSFPRVHRQLIREHVGEPGLLYSWQGTDRGLDPILFLAHYDVVPAVDEPTGSWTHPPFSGTIADGYVWGRGSLDDKGPLMALLEAAERLLQEGWEPRRTVLFAFGGDEESAGLRGAARIADLLRDRGVTTVATIDEGSILARGMLRFLDRPVALVGVAEKGYLDVRISAEQDSGHAAMPGRTTALGRVATAVARIVARPFPTKLTLPVILFLRAIGGDVSGAVGRLLRRPRIVGPLLRRLLAGSPVTEALIRTTQAPTMAGGSSAPNVLPDRAEIAINLRVLPGESCATTLARLRRLVRGTGVTVEAVPGASDPVALSPVDTPVYRMMKDTTRSLFPDAVVAPFLVTATTDSRRYREVSRAIYRFVPFELDHNDLAGIHGIDERVSLSAYRRAIAWYHAILGAAGGFPDD